MITTISNLFKIQYGDNEYESKESLDEGNTILISSKGEDNGVYGFYNIPKQFKAPYITVPRTGSIGIACVQMIDSTANSDCLVLIPKNKMTTEELYQVAFQIRMNKWKYQYGRKITPTRLGDQKIKIETIKIKFEKFSNELLPKENKKEKIIENKNIKLIKVEDLCNLLKKTAPPQNAISLDGDTPYVTTSSMNNGISEFVDEKPNFKGKCLTVSLNGSVGEVFFQINDFITSSDNAVLTLKEKYNPYLLFYIGSLIKTHKWRYNYYRKLSPNKLKSLRIPVPFKDNIVDIDYIEKIVKNSYGYNEIKKYL